MEMQAHRLRVRARRHQSDPFAHAQWLDFAEEYPEVCSIPLHAIPRPLLTFLRPHARRKVLDTLIYFVTVKDRYKDSSGYADGEELTACYGKDYHRAYGTANFAPPPTARVPYDEFDKAHRT